MPRGVPVKDWLAHALSFVDKVDGGCWNWTGNVTRSGGYGQFHIKRKTQLAHRFFYEQLVGPIPPGKCICHRCDNPRCVNPAHLFIGSHAENSSDMVRKGRQARGERNGRAKLDADRVREIRALRGGGMTLTAIAARYGVHFSLVSDIAHGRRWQHV